MAIQVYSVRLGLRGAGSGGMAWHAGDRGKRVSVSNESRIERVAWLRAGT